MPDEELFEGESLTIAITLSGDVVDISGGKARYVVVDSEDNTVIDKTESGGGITFTDPQNGELAVTFTPSDTEDESGAYEYFLRVEDSDGNVSIPLTGNFVIKPTPF